VPVDGRPGDFTKDQTAPASRRKAGPGRPPGLVNKLTREMQDAVLAAAEELGRVPYSKWRRLMLPPGECCKSCRDQSTLGFVENNPP